MAQAGEDEKRSRTTAKRKFTRCYNRLNESIVNKIELETITTKFSELRLLWDDVQSKHDLYLFAIHPDDEELADVDQDAWLHDLEEKFELIQKAKYDYIHSVELETKQSMELKIHQENQYQLSQNTAAALRNRDSLKLMLTHELNGIEEVVKMDSNGVLKTQVMTGIKDAKILLERCKEAHLDYTSKKEQFTEGDNTWIKGVLALYGSCNVKVYKYLQLISEIELKKKQNLGVRMERVKMPFFDSNIRNYAKFKRDFERQVQNHVDCGETLVYVLKSCLCEEALDVVKNVDDDIKDMWKRLDAKFGQPSMLIDIVMNEIKTIKYINDTDMKAFIKFIEIVEKGHADLSRLKIEKEMSNSVTVSMIEERLPAVIKREWSKEVNKDNSKVDPFNKFPELMKFLLEQKRIIEYEMSSLRALGVKKDDHAYVNYGGIENPAEADKTISSKWCIFHKTNSHKTEECSKYMIKEPLGRIELLKEYRACWSCLRVGHRLADCRYKKVCGIAECRSHHHASLHVPPGLTNLAMCLGCTEAPNLCLLPVMKVKSIDRELNVLWDTGASICLVTFEMAKSLKLKGKTVELSMVNVGGEAKHISSIWYNLPLVDKFNNVIYIGAYGIEKISEDLQDVDISSVIHRFKGVQMKDIQRPKGPVDVLVGFNYASLHPTMEQALGDLMIMENRFGRCLAGSHKCFDVNDKVLIHNVNIHHIMISEDSFLETESMGIQCTPKCGKCACGKCSLGAKGMSLREEREQMQINEGLVYQGGYFLAHYPWVKDPNQLPDNRVAAIRRLESTERRLLKSENLAQIYSEQIKDMLDRNVARILTEAEIRKYNGPCHYISHHEVLKNGSSSTPCRIVFDSSAKFQNHTLNDYWGKGANLVNNLVGVLLRFRENKVGVVGDIKKMYHAVKISELDQHTHRFLWRDLQLSRCPDTYVMTSVSFGDKPAGNIAIAALHKTAEMGKERFPEAANCLLTNTYVDDVIDSFDEESMAKRVTNEIDELIQLGGFEIKEWTVSSVKEVDYNGEPALIGNNYSKDDQKVLGVCWDPSLDILRYNVKLNFSPKKRGLRVGSNLQKSDIPSKLPVKLTKRLILSIVNSMFDPAGLITPFTVRGKILLKNLWKRKLQWDEEVCEVDRQCAVSFFEEMFELENIYFKRCAKPEHAVGNPIMVTFSDASEEAFGACVYLRWTLADGAFVSVLVGSKNRVAPMKVISIVRLELCGAIVAKRLSEFIETETRFTIEKKYFLVDSQVVKGMIDKESFVFNTFVAVRLGEIQSSTDASDWYWVDGHSNVADWITRGKKPSELDVDSEWQCGPAFLAESEEKWPIKKNAFIDDFPEMRKMEIISHLLGNRDIQSIGNIINIDRFSKYKALIHVTARIISVFRCIPKPSFRNIFLFPVDLLQEAELIWILDAQKSMVKEIEKGAYRRLCPRKREDGVLVVGGRAVKLFLDNYNTPGLILLPHSHRLSLLYAEFVHGLSHLGTATTVCKIRNKFWITRLNPMVKRIRNRCVRCRELNLKSEEQIMSELPMHRLKPAPAFHTTFVDLFGPFEIRSVVNKRSRGKAFGVLFTCGYSRAVHCDLSVDYSMDGFLQTLRRFTSIRGYPGSIHSDCGSQLVACEKELRNLVKNYDREKLKQFGADEGLKWKFSPPNAPWRNGCVEALVKSVKRSIKVAVGDQVLSFPELQTVLYEAANLVNERPIGVHSNQIDDDNYLSPNELLLGRASARVPSGPFDENCGNRKRYLFVQSIVNAFWRKWLRDFFPSLLVRQKWHSQKRNIQVGDIVLIKDLNAVRGEWRRGQVVKTYCDETDEKVVRTVDIRYKLPTRKTFTIIKRAVQECYSSAPCGRKQLFVNSLNRLCLVGSVLFKIVIAWILNYYYICRYN